MAKFSGVIGYVEVEETSQDVHEEIPTERKIKGDILMNNKRSDHSEQLNNNLNVNNRFSFVADPYARNHFYAMRYFKYLGAYWNITEAEVQYPRIIFSIGGIYNGITAATGN